MKNKTSILLITLLALSGLMVLATMPATTQANGEHTIYIGAVDGQIAFNETSIELELDTTYTIVFVNPDAITPHNLRIDTNQNIEDGDVDDPNDITVGLDNGDTDGVNGSWNATWTTPATDGVYTFYCGYAGHYSQGMEGEFIVGNPVTEDNGSFGALAGISALLVAALAIPQLRKR